MNIDRDMLKLLGPVTSVLGALIAVGTAARSGPKRGAAVVSALLGLVGSTAWLIAAYEDHIENRTELDRA